MRCGGLQDAPPALVGAAGSAARTAAAASVAGDGWAATEDTLHPAQAGRQAVDIVGVAVDVEGGTAGGRLAESLVERLRAVVAGTDGDRLAVEQRGHVVRVRLRQGEGDDAGTLGRGAGSVDADARHLAGQHLERVGRERLLVGRDAVHADGVEIVDAAPRPMAAAMSGVPASNL